MVAALAVTLSLGGCSYGPFQPQSRAVPRSIEYRPDDPYFVDGNQWYLEAISAPEAWGLYRAVAADPVSAVLRTAVPVAVIDTGVDGGHEDLVGVLTDTGYDFFLDNDRPAPNGFAASTPGITHGTHVTGLVATGTSNGRGISGAAYAGDGFSAAVVVPLRALAMSSQDNVLDVIEALLYAAGLAPPQPVPRARIVNLSLGLVSPSRDSDTVLLFRAVLREVADRGVLAVAAAGNDGRAGGIDAPAFFDTVIAVGSVDRAADPADSVRSSFSDYGPELELMAPGATVSESTGSDIEGILSTVPDDRYGLQPGTSMAAPLVAGAAAMVWSANPDLTAAEVRQILRDTATDLHTPGRDDETGWGLVDAHAALERALTAPYGRYDRRVETAADGGGRPGAGELFTDSRDAFRYDHRARRDLIVVLDPVYDPEAFRSALATVERDAAIRVIGRVPTGTLVRVPVGADTDVAALLAVLRGDERVIGIAENGPIAAIPE